MPLPPHSSWTYLHIVGLCNFYSSALEISSFLFFSMDELRHRRWCRASWICLNVLGLLPTSKSSFASNRPLIGFLFLSSASSSVSRLESSGLCSLFRLYYSLINYTDYEVHSRLDANEPGRGDNLCSLISSFFWHLMVVQRRPEEVPTRRSRPPLHIVRTRAVLGCLVWKHQHSSQDWSISVGQTEHQSPSFDVKNQYPVGHTQKHQRPLLGEWR